jgi:hypothetical protein
VTTVFHVRVDRDALTVKEDIVVKRQVCGRRPTTVGVNDSRRCRGRGIEHDLSIRERVARGVNHQGDPGDINGGDRVRGNILRVQVCINPNYTAGRRSEAVPRNGASGYRGSGGITQAVGSAGLIVSVQMAMAVLFAWSTTVRESTYVPAFRGVPVMAPVVEFKLRPPGAGPKPEKEYGGTPPLATKLELYGTPTVQVLA